jgi:hypothetical protein
VPLKVLFDAKVAVQDQLADVTSLLMVPGVVTGFQICAHLRGVSNAASTLSSLWLRFGVLLVARLATGIVTEEILHRKLAVLARADKNELQILPDEDDAKHRQRYLRDLAISPLLLEPIRNIERCVWYFSAVALVCAFAVFQPSNLPVRYAFIAV